MRSALLLFVAIKGVAIRYGEQPRGGRVFVAVAVEGVGGVVSAHQLGPGSFEYERFRNFMTQEALAAVEGARQAGATEDVIADAHGNEENLLIEQFPADVRVVRGEPRHGGMMGGIDGSFDA